ncbi:plasmid replication initiation protein [Lentilactobacillus kefiri]|uniref:replication initiator protein A n=2 Tax=Lentilactobacillus kefiri TaxID=33962 RepID=UPI000BA525BE|nr:replication initiator protein A [Lentilactobacillus kefiri]MDM7493733.1 replication initiator protein A [Lentilactobacillus kefiri]PAK58584.1 plasmid replication initiation protein [Lentilactobacillus kefiri]PAK80961.1 plasmid replication initiation protein [Lentilactobacillus kefiri]PAL05293.1 plasmid replication initiation protein [Lentilactobacillus kefiri]
MTKSKNFNYYEADNVYGALFFQFPKVLMYGEQYKHLSSDAKLAYMVLKDRLEYSLRNHWVDEDNHVYFIFTVQELQDLFNCATEKAVKIKKELQTANLLKQIQMGFNPKTKKNEPNRLYLSKLDVKATDVYLRGEYGQETPKSLATSGISKIESPHDFVGSLATSGISKIESPHDFVDNSSQSLATSGISKIESNLYKDSKNIDTNRYNIDTQKLDFSTAHFSPAEIQKQNQDLVNHANDFLTDEDSGLPVFLEPEAVQLLSFWCRTPQQMRRFIGIILNAKYRVEKDHQDVGVLIPLDDEELKPLMTKALRRYFNALRSNEKHIKNVENYLYGTMQNLFGVWWNKQAAREYAAKHPEEEKSADNDSSGLYY